MIFGMFIYLMVFFSGFAGLVYQVLWMRQLGLLFGSTSHAAAATLGAFFAGLAAGSWFWGLRMGRSRNPLRTYAWLEVGIGATALLYFGILTLFYAIYPLLYQSFGNGALLLGVKFVLALLLVFPPAFCMGGTIPAIGQHLIRKPEHFGKTSALLYGINTLGAAIGAFLTGFWFVEELGFRLTCLLAILISSAIAAGAHALSRTTALEPAPEPDEKKSAKKNAVESGEARDRWVIPGVAFLSGFGVLSLEVIWTRLFAQIHENSVYSFASVLIIVLTTLALGAAVSSLLARLPLEPMGTLAALTICCGMAVAFGPALFMHVTEGLKMIPTSDSITNYALSLYRIGFLSIGGIALVLGTLFPFLMKAEERYALVPGLSLGRLAAINTLGAILGSLLCGFVLLSWFGVWQTMQGIGALYLIAGMVLVQRWNVSAFLLRSLGVAGLILLFTVLDPKAYPVTHTNPGHTLVAAWEGSSCTVAVVDYPPDHRGIQVNSNYGLGSTAGFPHQVFQARIPLFIFPETKSVFFLGLGTGSTAGGALHPEHKVERLVACELIREVVTASKKYMTHYLDRDFTLGLFKDPRAQVVVEDGRHYLMASNQTFDMINADLFLPYRSGAGSLYSREHFVSARKRLTPDGVFVQWLPLYQLTEMELGIVTRTMLEVFPRVTLWRNNFRYGGEIVALVGHNSTKPLPPCSMDIRKEKATAVRGRNYRNIKNLVFPFNEQSVLLFYCGNVTAARELFQNFPVNTDDKPLIEHLSPRNLRKGNKENPPTFIGPRLSTLIKKIQLRCPPATDPMLTERTPENRCLPLAGLAMYQAHIGFDKGDLYACREAWRGFLKAWLPDLDQIDTGTVKDKTK